MVELTPGERNTLIQIEERTRTVSRGAVLLREHDRMDELFVVREGMMMAYVLLDDGSRQIVRFLFPGDIFALSMSGAWPSRALVQTAGYDGGADFSPDGRTMVYASTDSGLSQVYLSPFPAMDRKWTVSTSGGTQPRFSRDGRQIFYRDGNRMMAVAVSASGGQVSLSPPRVLFDRQFSSGGYITIANYDVLPDGSFVIPEAVPGPARLTVVSNWLEVLRRQLAVP